MHIFLYGPPGSGKSTLGSALAAELDMPFCDVDALIESQAQMTVAQIFDQEGEHGFREREFNILRHAQTQPPTVYALGGGALLNPGARALAETSGQVLCLEAGLETLLHRMGEAYTTRPLLAEAPVERLKSLLTERSAHYRSFPLRLDTSSRSIEKLCWEAQVLLGSFYIKGMGKPYRVVVAEDMTNPIGQLFHERNLNGPVALVSDQNVGAIYIKPVEEAIRAAGYSVYSLLIPAGENYKTIETVTQVWNFLINAGIERDSTIVALGGGVTGDLTGFAAATFLRGVQWANLPTSLLAMVDASLGGKTAVDLPQAKNLVGAFYSPRLVVADPAVLKTLPDREFRSGMAEVVKHGVIDDPELFDVCAQGWETAHQSLNGLIRRAMAVKVKFIQQDPYEKGMRKALNLGHTIGHGIEIASHFQLSHGEAVAVGMVAEARLAEFIGEAKEGLAEQIAGVLSGLGLPTRVPEGLSVDRIIQTMQLDKKRQRGKVHFALPVDIGQVKWDAVVEDWQDCLRKVLWTEEGKR